LVSRRSLRRNLSRMKMVCSMKTRMKKRRRRRRMAWQKKRRTVWRKTRMRRQKDRKACCAYVYRER